jgi:transcription elongation factor GreA
MPIIPFTPAAYAQLKAEKHDLQTERKAVIIRLQTAREMGDLSENGAYKYAKQELGDIGRKLRKLNYLLAEGEVIQPKSHSVVEFGSSVDLAGPSGTKTYLIVSEYESNPVERKLAMTSPIGAAIMGKKVGDVVNVETPNGNVQFTISAIQ